MAQNLVLQDFSSAAPQVEIGAPATPGAQSTDDSGLDDLESYDAAYKSGWADCAAAEAEALRSVGADLARNLADATLTFENARRDVLAALNPLFEEIASTLLPQMAAAAVAPTVIAELGKLATDQTNVAVEIHAAPSACSALDHLVEAEGLQAVTVRPEPAFADGQVSIRVGGERSDLDLNAAAAEIAAAITGFSTQSETIHEPHKLQGTA